ncbi:MAG: branched-chain amino acid ABC transporter permease, partial [Mycobacteriales bacterium]
DRDTSTSYLAAREARPIPQALRALAVVRRNSRLLLGAVVLTVLVYPLAMSPGQVVLGTGILLTALVALSILVLTGWAGQISLGQMGFAAVGAWTAAVLSSHYHLPFLLCLLGAALSGAMVAVIVGLPALRLRGLNLAVVTLCFSVSIISILFTSDYLGGALPDHLDRPFLLGLDLNNEPTYYYFSLVLLLLFTLSVVGMRRSKFARVLIAARDNEDAAQSLGVSLLRRRLEGFAVSGFLAAFAGGLIAFHQNGAIAITFGPDQSIQVFLMTVIGGLGSIAGPLLGAAYLGLIAIIADPTLSVLATGGGLVAMLILAPGGLASIVYRVRDLLFRRIALRRRIVVPGLVEEEELTAGVVRAPIVPKTVAGGQQYVAERYRRPDNWRKIREVG